MIRVRRIILAVLAGIYIGIGGTAYLLVDNKVIGAVLFSFGVVMVCVFDLNLFTGKLCFALQKKIHYIIDLIEIGIGNFTGAVITGVILRFTRIKLYPDDIAEAKMNDDLLSVFILALLCGLLLYGSVAGYMKTKNFLIAIFPITVFVVCGFDNCIANSFYFALYGVWNIDVILCLLISTLGNITGTLIPQIMIYKKI